MGDKILVLLGPSYSFPVETLGEIITTMEQFMEDPKAFKLVLYTGGADVDPAFYGDKSPDKVCWISAGRDQMEQDVFEIAFDCGIPMAGICRGLQFLNVMAGGRLMHHIWGHGGAIHMIETASTGDIEVNSIHHQMIVPAKGTEVIAWSKDILSPQGYIGRNDEPEEYHGKEIEGAIFPDIKAFGVQYHPELMSENLEGHLYFHNMCRNALEMEWDSFIKAYTTKDSSDVEPFKVRADHHKIIGR